MVASKDPREGQGVGLALLTGGGDKPYVFGLATALISRGISVDLIGSDELDCPEFHQTAEINFLNLRGDTNPHASFFSKASRIVSYYARLIGYALTARPRIFHVLWNNRFETIDRTLLMLYYKLLGKKVVLTVHNVNTAKRDSKDSLLNRATLGVQYRLADHLFVHTQKMKNELIGAFRVDERRVTVIPLGINNAVPRSNLTTREARRRLGLREGEKTILFFGRIAPYKGLEYLVAAFRQLLSRKDGYRLIIAGSLKNCAPYWKPIQESLHEYERTGKVLLRVEFIPDEETEVYFKAAHLFVLPYRQVYDSGVLYLGYSFGLPVVVADVGSLKDEIMEGTTGFAFRPEDSLDLAKTIERYFSSDLYRDLKSRREAIEGYAAARHSWEVVSQATLKVYADLLQLPVPAESPTCGAH